MSSGVPSSVASVALVCGEEERKRKRESKGAPGGRGAGWGWILMLAGTFEFL